MDITPLPDASTTAARARISELVGNFEFCHAGLQEIASLLPPGDDEMHRWLEQAIASQAENEFVFIIFAAAMAGRKLSSSLLPAGMFLFPDEQRLAWVAWHMEGDVFSALIQGLDAGGIPLRHSVLALFVAAAWWFKYRPGQDLPKKIGSILDQVSKMGSADPVLLGYAAALVDLTEVQAIEATGKRPAVPGAPGAGLSKMRKTGKRTRERLVGMLERPFSELIQERAVRRFTGTEPYRRETPKVRRNHDCHCGSKKKYKACCEKTDLARRPYLLGKAGKTSEGAEDVHADLNLGRLQKLRPVELLKLDPLRVPEDLRNEYVKRLGAFKRFEALATAFEKFGVPEALEQSWRSATLYALRAGQSAALQRIVQASGRTEYPASCRLSLVRDEPVKFLETLEQASLAALQEGSPGLLTDIAMGLLFSPYRALGILVARGTLPLRTEEEPGQIYEDILTARAELNLSPDDELADYMEEKTAREETHEEDTAIVEKRAELEAAAARSRRLAEDKAALQRDLRLSQKREREAAAAAGAAPATVGPSEETRALQAQLKKVEALLREAGTERIAGRREMAAIKQELARWRLAGGLTEDGKEQPEDEPGEPANVTAQQPVRLLRFTANLSDSLDRVPRQVGAAVLTHLGRLAAGDANEIARLKKMHDLDGVLHSRVGDYRVLFRFMPKHVEVMDLVNRRDLKKRLKALRSFGLPETTA